MALNKPLWVLNGPNLNLLGQRAPDIYGAGTLQDLEQRLTAHGQNRNVTIACKQSNLEGQLVDWLHQTHTQAAGVILNAGAYTHTSIALADAVEAIDVPVLEVHLSNIYAREAYRHHSYISAHAIGVIAGLGPMGYQLAIDALLHHLSS